MYYNNDDQVKRIADALEKIAKQGKIGNMMMAADGMYLAGVITEEQYGETMQKLLEEAHANG